MSYAYRKGTSDFSKKHSDWGVWTMMIQPSGEVTHAKLNITEFMRSENIELHGWFMWSAWFVVGLLLLVTKRYAKKTWVFSHYLHAILGYFTLIVTLVFAFRVAKFEPFESIHNALGTLCVIVTIVGSLSGSATAALMRGYNGDKPWSKKEKVQVVAQIHRIAGYVMLFVGNAAIMTGFGNYFNHRLQGDQRSVLGYFNMIVFVLLVAIFEAAYRIRNKYSMGFVQTPNTAKDKTGRVHVMTPERVDALVGAGQPLVIFDNLVLNLNGYERVHPGGKFNLTHNYGRDISKFFFGGYQLVNVPKERPHTHSQAALDIV